MANTERNRGAHDQDYRQGKADRTGKERREAGEEQVDERDKRQDQEPVAAKLVSDLRELAARQAEQAALPSLQMHRPEAGGEIEERRDDRGRYDVGVGH